MFFSYLYFVFKFESIILFFYLKNNNKFHVCVFFLDLYRQKKKGIRLTPILDISSLAGGSFMERAVCLTRFSIDLKWDPLSQIQKKKLK